MLIRRAAISPDNCVDLRIEGERIAAIAPNLEPDANETFTDAAGNALIPGLHDHHMHLLSLAASLRSLDCRPPAVDSRETLASAIRRAEANGEIRGTGYFEGSDNFIDRHWLDAVRPDIPVRIQHRSGRLWILNSAAIQSLQVDDGEFPDSAERDDKGALTGRFFHADDWLRAQLPKRPLSLDAISRRLAACGVTGLTDAGPDNDVSTLALLRDAQQRGELRQRVLMMGRADLPDIDTPMLASGAHKIYLKEPSLPDYNELCEHIRSTHARQRACAFHCVTRVELQFALAALADCGTRPGDRIEHASIADDEALAQIKALDLTVVTQPHFIAERGDQYREQVDADDQPCLYRGRGFIAAGIPFAAGTDAPFGNYDPWRAMRAAVARRTVAGKVMNAAEALAAQQALNLFLGEPGAPGGAPRAITVGAPADLCLLQVSWGEMLGTLSSEQVTAVWRGGERIY